MAGVSNGFITGASNTQIIAETNILDFGASDSSITGGSASYVTPGNIYVAEDGTSPYVAEDGTTGYIPSS